VCVEVAVRDDPGLIEALASLDRQQRRPDRVLVAASTDSPQRLLDDARSRFPALPLTVRRYPGGVVDARAASLNDVTEMVTAFLDSDERAPPEWLERLVAPIEAGTVTFVGGPTRPTRPPEGSIERYMVLLEASIYADLVPRSVTYLPLQNTAWRTDRLRELGFDARIPFAEDHDLEVRAARAGWVGTFVADAWVFHDKSSESSFPQWAHKRYRYLVALAMSMIKNGELRGRLSERRRPVAHPLRYIEALMKPVALVHAELRWRRAALVPARSTTRPGSPPGPGSG
jgi:GT2 family glycosyltransferase